MYAVSACRRMWNVFVGSRRIRSPRQLSDCAYLYQKKEIASDVSYEPKAGPRSEGSTYIPSFSYTEANSDHPSASLYTVSRWSTSNAIPFCNDSPAAFASDVGNEGECRCSAIKRFLTSWARSNAARTSKSRLAQNNQS